MRNTFIYETGEYSIALLENIYIFPDLQDRLRVT
jgi:hypothetical protein